MAGLTFTCNQCYQVIPAELCIQHIQSHTAVQAVQQNTHTITTYQMPPANQPYQMTTLVAAAVAPSQFQAPPAPAPFPPQPAHAQWVTASTATTLTTPPTQGGEDHHHQQQHPPPPPPQWADPGHPRASPDDVMMDHPVGVLDSDTSSDYTPQRVKKVKVKKNPPPPPQQQQGRKRSSPGQKDQGLGQQQEQLQEHPGADNTTTSPPGGGGAPGAKPPRRKKKKGERRPPRPEPRRVFPQDCTEFPNLPSSNLIAGIIQIPQTGRPPPPGQEFLTAEGEPLLVTSPHICSTCFEKFDHKEALDDHVTREHVEFTAAGTKKTSQTKISKDEIYQCTSCGAQFPQKWRILRHVATHLDVTPWECVYCDMNSMDYNAVVYHLTKFHDVTNVSPRLNAKIDLDTQAVVKPVPKLPPPPPPPPKKAATNKVKPTEEYKPPKGKKVKVSERVKRDREAVKRKVAALLAEEEEESPEEEDFDEADAQEVALPPRKRKAVRRAAAKVKKTVTKVTTGKKRGRPRKNNATRKNDDVSKGEPVDYVMAKRSDVSLEIVKNDESCDDGAMTAVDSPTKTLHVDIIQMEGPPGEEDEDQKFADLAVDVDESADFTLLKKPQWCELCKELYKYRETFEEHCRTKHGHSPYECDMCFVMTVTQEAYDKHMESHAEEEVFVCKFCEATFTKEADLRYHVRKGHALTCKTCEKTFENADALSKHRKSGHKNHMCAECGRAFTRPYMLREHEEKHAREAEAKSRGLGGEAAGGMGLGVGGDVVGSPGKRRRRPALDEDFIPCKCDLCGKMYTNRSTLKSHIKRHGVEGMLRCMTCDMILGDRHTLKEHVKTCRPKTDKIFQCPLCSKEFAAKPVYRKHMLEAHGQRPTSDNAKCPVCDQVFATRLFLVQHLDLHHPDFKPAECQKCPRRFALLFQLENHRKRKHGNKKYCPICNKAFTINSCLRDHMTTHSDVRAFQCSECESAFKTRTQLIQHLKWMHRANMPVDCDHCGSSLCSVDALKQHMKKKHRDLLNLKFQCNQCAKRFAQKEILLEHMTSHPGTKPFQCKECGECFTYASSLDTHTKNKHPKQVVGASDVDSSVVDATVGDNMSARIMPSVHGQETIRLQSGEALQEMEVNGQKVYVIVNTGVEHVDHSITVH